MDLEWILSPKRHSMSQFWSYLEKLVLPHNFQIENCLPSERRRKSNPSSVISQLPLTSIIRKCKRKSFRGTTRRTVVNLQCTVYRVCTLVLTTGFQFQVHSNNYFVSTFASICSALCFVCWKIARRFLGSTGFSGSIWSGQITLVLYSLDVAKVLLLRNQKNP